MPITVTGFTAARMLEIEQTTIVDGTVVGDDLILTTRGGTDINAGSVRGPQGIQGPTGEVTTAAMNAALAAEHVGTAQLVDGAVTTPKIPNSAVTTAKIADQAVTGAKIPANAINNGHLAANSVDSGQYVDGSIDAAHLANNSVTAAAIAANAVGSSEIANGAVGTAQLANGSVTNAILGNDSVNSSKIANNAINSEHYVDGSIDNAHYANGSITAGKLSKYASQTSLGSEQILNGASWVNYLTVGSFSAPAGSILIVTATWDFRCTVLGDPFVACIGDVLIDGVAQNDQGVFVAPESPGRATITKVYTAITGNLGSTTVVLRARKNLGFGEYRLGNQHTTLKVLCIPG